MAKRIFRNVVLTAILAVLLTAAVIVPSLYTVYENRLSRELRQMRERIVVRRIWKKWIRTAGSRFLQLTALYCMIVLRMPHKWRTMPDAPR